MKINYIKLGELDVAASLYDLVKDEISPDTGIDADYFWNALAEIVRDLAPGNEELLKVRDDLQEKIDSWHREHRLQPHDPQAYKDYLRDIGYLTDEQGNFQITTTNIDAEIAEIAGPQLIVPLDNTRYV